MVNSNPYRAENAPVMSPADFIGESEEPSEEEMAESFKILLESAGRAGAHSMKKQNG